MSTNPRVQRAKTALRRVIDVLTTPRYAALGLAALLAYGLVGTTAALAVLVGGVIVLAVPRLRQRLTKWLLLHGFIR